MSAQVLPRMESTLFGALAVVLVCIATVTTYAVGLEPLLVLDDYASIEPLLTMGDAALPWRDVIVSPTGPLGRPVAMLSFLVDRHVHGSELEAWKVTNLVLHLLIGLGLYALALEVARIHMPERDALVASLAAALWLMHPIQVSTVLYTVQRMTQLSMFFCVIGMLSYVKARTRRPDTRFRRVLLASPLFLWFPLATLSKENGALLPLFLMLMEKTVLTGVPESCRRSLRLVFAVYLGAMLLGALILAANIFGAGAEAVIQRRGFSAFAHLLSQAQVLLDYLHQILLPTRSGLGFFHDDISISRGLLNPPQTLAALCVHATLLGLGWCLRTRLPLIAFGSALFYAGHLMESSLIPLEMMFEHRNYLPSFGILLAAVALFSGIRAPGLARLSAILGLGMLAVLTLVTRSLVQDWSTPARFYRAAFELHPDSPVARAEWAEFLTVSSQYREARAVLAASPDPTAQLQIRVLECRSQGELPPSGLEPELVDNLSYVSVYTTTALTELAKQVLDGRCAADRTELAVMLGSVADRPGVWPPFRYRLYVYQAHLLWESGRPSDAFQALERAALQAPMEVIAPLLAAEWRLARGEPALAHALLKEVRARHGSELTSQESQMLQTLETEVLRAQP